jgi:phage-related protein
MNEWISFRGVRSDSISHVRVAEMPVASRGAMRFTQYSVKGRDGTLQVNEGYEPYDVKCKLILYQCTAVEKYNINLWASGSGRLIASDDPSRAWIATVNEAVTWKRYKTGNKYNDVAEITWTCQPIMREAVESEETFTASGAIANIGTVDSYPMITVHGSGDCVFSVAGQEIILTDVDAGTPVYIDCENGYVYTENGAAEMTGEFPVLGMGENAVILTSGVTRIDIKPRWGWL